MYVEVDIFGRRYCSPQDHSSALPLRRVWHLLRTNILRPQFRDQTQSVSALKQVGQTDETSHIEESLWFQLADV